MRPIITTSTSNNQYSEHTVPSSPTTSHEGATDVSHQAHQHLNHDDTTTTTPNVELRQRLMVADEVYLYKIPPLQTSGGHRAENWNLASPIATCSLLVERRGDCLVLEFRQIPNESSSSSQQLPTTFGSQVINPIFAQAVIDCSVLSTTVPVSSIGISNESSTTLQPQPPQQQQQRKIQHWIEGTIDSSRYFTLRISSNGGREALIGFGFRDRDTAIDLRESLQHYEASMRREYEASIMMTMMNDGNGNNNNDTSPFSKYTIPKLADGERIHIRTGKSGKDNPSIVKSKSKSTNNSPNKAGRPILLKKPPPSASDSDTSHNSNNASIEDIVPQLSNELSNHCTIAATSTTTTTTTTDLQQNDDTNNSPVVHQDIATGNDNDDDDDDDWDTEFVSASY